ncbi:MAG: hypothetical protein GXO39_09085 [Thermotogae bacterium]|nr:hypothetical protein [Thermotogota bacterium]
MVLLPFRVPYGGNFGFGRRCAKWIAHIGVLKFFQEKGIEFDLVVGCSMGVIAEGSYAVSYEGI